MMRASKFLRLLTAAALGLTMMPLVPASAATVITENTTGSEDGYDYELWKDSGTTSMTLTGGGTFSCEWSNINNALFRKGQKFDCTKTYEELGNVQVDYNVDYNPNGNSYLCVYGWTKEPLVEYYIVESWGTWRPPGATSMGTISVDGGTYDVYHTIRENQPSIIGNTTFDQYWSVRTDKKTSGTISVSQHFAAWEEMGLEMGKMYEVALCVEGYQSSGSATVKQFDISVGGEIQQPTDPAPVEPDANGYYFHSTFESGTDGWSVRGDDSVTRLPSAAYAGDYSLFVSDRTDSWNGAGYNLSTSTFVPGQSYSFSAMVMQDIAGSEDFKLTLQYTLDGEEKYAGVAEATGTQGEWVQLANTSFAIPAGATNLLLYVETADTTTSFFMDEAIGAKAGTVYEADGPVNVEPVVPTGTYGDLPLGDTVLNGIVDVLDIIQMQKFMLGASDELYVNYSYPEYIAETANADMDHDGAITAYDLAILKRMVLNGTANIPPEDPTEDPTEAPTEEVLEEGEFRNTADISWIDTSKPMVAFAFDDGPISTAQGSAPIRIQDALANNGAHATFFYWGNRITSSNEAEIVRANELGFEIANHTYSHPYLTGMSVADLQSEINRCADILTRLTGKTDFLIRPPYLAVDDTVRQYCGAPLITCSVDSQDWNGASKDQIINTVVSKANDGSLDNAILLMHENYESTAGAVEYLVPYLKAQGWEVVSVSELFKANGKKLYNGTVYRDAN